MSTLTTVTEDKKRWMVYGIALNHVIVPAIRPILEQEILKEYNFLKANHGIDVQTSHSFPVSRYPHAMKYENINGNDTKLKPPQCKKYDYSKFDYQVASHVDFAKLFLHNYMAKLNAFNETCDASAELSLIGRIPVFSVSLQNAANIVREGRNAWGHCNFTEWNEANFKTRFGEIEQLVKEIGLSPADKSKVLTDLRDWETKGVSLCMNANIDPELAKVVQEHVNKLSSDVENMIYGIEVFDNMNNTLKNIQLCFNESMERITKIECDQDVLRKDQSSTGVKVEKLENRQKDVEKRVTDLEGQTSSLDFSSCEADIKFYAERYDPCTRQWLLKDFDTWFTEQSESRAYVLLGDAAVGKSVMAAVIAERAKNDGNLAATYFCRHYDGTRCDPRYLLGTIAHQLRNCNSEYDSVVGGEAGIQRMLTSDKLGVHELFTKLLEEPLSKCGSCERKLVVIDALDETEYLSREDFLDLIMNRFPLLPKWLVFFITSRPEDTVQFRLRTYNPCIKICSGNSESADLYQQHEEDIQRFLENEINFSVLSYSAEDLTKRCHGMFLYAFYIVEFVKTSTTLEGDIFPENINEFFRKNFERVYKKTGSDFYKKLFGCALAAPSPLPVSFISFILQKENSTLDEQEVIDTVSLFVAWRTSDKTFEFLHNLIPAWVTDKEKARRLFIDRNKANEYFRKCIVGFMNAYLGEEKKLFSYDSGDLVDYVLGNGIRFLCKCSIESSDSSEIIFDCLTNYGFLQHRIRSKIGIYSLIEDFKFSIVTQTFIEKKKNILDDVCSALEQDKYAIAGNPELLYSCLRNATKLSQENMMLNSVSTSWMRLLYLDSSLPDLLDDMKCGAFSHDKKLFVGGKNRCIYLYDTSTFRKIFGPFQVTSEDILHLEFSPDDMFVFFGRLDSWLSVQEKRVVEITQFSGNPKCYEWGSFVYGGKYIALSQKLRYFTHTSLCFSNIFFKWIVKEFSLEQENTTENIIGVLSSFCVGDLKFSSTLIHHLLDLQTESVARIKGLCSRCAEFEYLKTPVRDCIVLLYADIFKHQIWNVQTGRPVIEEMFSSEVKLKPFFYLWHFFPAMNGYENAICDESMTLGNVAVLNLPFNLSGYTAFARSLGHLDENNFYLITNSPVECYNFLLKDRKILSKNGKWLANYRWGKIELFEIERGGRILLNHTQNLGYALGLEWLALTNDGNILMYTKLSFARQGHTLSALSIHTGTDLPYDFQLPRVRCESVDSQTIEFDCLQSRIFFGHDEKISELLSALPCEFWSHLSSTRTERINVVFTATDTIMLAYSNATYISLEIADGFVGTTIERVSYHSHSKAVSVKKCIFSSDGKLIAIHESCQLLLFDGHKFLCSVFNVENCEHTITCLTFSPDDRLLLFCIQKGNDVQSVYVWDVLKQVLCGPVEFPYRMSVDCGCFSSDSTKLFLCNASSVLVLEEPPKFVRFSKNYEIPKVSNSTLQSCSYCTVSSDDQLLAFCVANEILIFPLNRPGGTFCKVPHNHLGRIEFCKFLKGNRYLISYAIDYMVVLFDILEWKPVAYTRLQESIMSMAVSPNEHLVVCLKSSGYVSILKLHELKLGLPSNFLLTLNFGLPERNREQPRRRQSPRCEPRLETESKEDDSMLLSPSDFYDSSDEDMSDELDSDKI